MNLALNELIEPAITQAIEKNYSSYWRYMGRASLVNIIESGKIFGFKTSLEDPFFTAILESKLARKDIGSDI